MILTYTQKKLLVFFKNRLFTDLISWIILFLLVIGTMTIDLWRQSDGNVDGFSFAEFVNENPITNEADSWLIAFKIIVRDSFFILLGLMFVAYFNLTFLKQRLFNTKLDKWQRFGWYLSSVIILSLALALVWVQIGQFFDEYLRLHVEFALAAFVNFCVAMVSTGMLSMKELKDVRAKVDDLREELKVIKVQQKKEDLTFYTNHIKVGSKKKWQIVPYDDIYFFKGGGNDPQIFMKNGRVWGSSKLEEYGYFLPKNKFIRVHRSYIIAKEWVRERDGNHLYLVDLNGDFIKDEDGKKMGIPISESYMKNVDEDAYLMFLQENK